MRFPHWSLAGLAGFLLLVLGMAAKQEERPSPLPAMAAAPSEFRGSGSCSAVACHGSIAPRPRADILRNEHTTWISNDRHARAFESLFGAQAERIMRNLAGGKESFKPASQDHRCLACHTTPRSAAVLARTSWMNPDGVGCESCHGASGSWLGPHTTEAWKARTDRREKEKQGLKNTKDLAPRAEVCAGCHVGEHSQTGLLDRDVNHDLIAAGHPRLYFELAAFLANMPPHWTEKDENADSRDRTKPAADFPARAWAIGRLVTLRASLELLAARATDLPGTAWPEFSEYGCFSCHHSLRDETWRRARPRASAGTVAGTPVWGSWPLPLIDELIETLGATSDARSYTESLGRLAREMAKPNPRRTVVNQESRQAVESLNRYLMGPGARHFQAGEVDHLIAALDQPEAWKRVASWDEAAQRYLALLWLRQASVDFAGDRKTAEVELKARLDEIFGKLIFPRGFDSPNGFDPGKLPKGP